MSFVLCAHMTELFHVDAWLQPEAVFLWRKPKEEPECSSQHSASAYAKGFLCHHGGNVLHLLNQKRFRSIGRNQWIKCENTEGKFYHWFVDKEWIIKVTYVAYSKGQSILGCICTLHRRHCSKLRYGSCMCGCSLVPSGKVGTLKQPRAIHYS